MHKALEWFSSVFTGLPPVPCLPHVKKIQQPKRIAANALGSGSVAQISEQKGKKRVARKCVAQGSKDSRKQKRTRSDATSNPDDKSKTQLVKDLMAEGIVGKRLAEEAFTRHNIHRKVVSKVVSAVKGGTKRATAKAIVSAMWEDNADMGDIVEALEKQRFTRRTIYINDCLRA